MRVSRCLFVSVVILVLCMSALAGDADAAAQTTPSVAPALTAEQVINRFLQRETGLIQAMRKYHPVVETYLQNVKPDYQLGTVPASDKYFLGRLDSGKGVEEVFYSVEQQENFLGVLFKPLKKLYSVDISPVGFSKMVYIDRGRFDRAHYDFKFLRREFLGEVRTLVFEVYPKSDAGRGLFKGRIWVEDRDYNIVRFNGTYINPARSKLYFHMDSWRENMRGDLWLPSHVYSEETDLADPSSHGLTFKSQTRLWGYDLKNAGRQEELTQITVENVKDESEVQEETTPVLSLRAWQREAEDNALDRLEKAGLLARRGDVDKVLETVVNNLQITNNLDIQPEVRCRVMLTTPLESFTVGHTIVMSRGLLDVLPDEASLAMILAHELAHIAQGDQIDTKYSFADRMGAPDEQSLSVFHFERSPGDEFGADVKALDFLKNSPYKDKLGNVGLFLKALQLRAAAIRNLTAPRLGNGLADGSKVTRMKALMASAPELQMRELDQIPALPLGGRIKLDSWDDSVALVKAKPVPLLSQKEKMPFEVTPTIPHLVRAGDPNAVPKATPVAAPDSSSDANAATNTAPVEQPQPAASTATSN